MPTIHQYINDYPAQSNYKRVLLGTIHPPEVENFRIQFFYGNRGNLWDFLSEAFPHLNFNTRDEIVRTLSGNDVWISDIIRQCDHRNGNAADDQLDNIVLNTEQIRLGLTNSQIDTIFFTSEFTFTLFKRGFCIRLRFDRLTREMTIPSHYFGRPIKAIVLYSPSDNACRGIAKSLTYKNWQRTQALSGLACKTKDFRVAYYRDKMSFWNPAK